MYTSFQSCKALFRKILYYGTAAPNFTHGKSYEHHIDIYRLIDPSLSSCLHCRTLPSLLSAGTQGSWVKNSFMFNEIFCTAILLQIPCLKLNFWWCCTHLRHFLLITCPWRQVLHSLEWMSCVYEQRLRTGPKLRGGKKTGLNLWPTLK
jgi:hypothetical protein